MSFEQTSQNYDPAITMRSVRLRERMRSDEGSITGDAKLIGKIVVMGTVLATFAGVGLVNYRNGLGISLETTEEQKTEVELNEVVETFTLPETICYGGFESRVNATTKFDKVFKFGPFEVNTPLGVSRTFNGNISTYVCTVKNDADGVPTITKTFDPNTGTMTVDVPSEAFTVINFPTNPADKEKYQFTGDAEVLAAQKSALQDIIKSIDGTNDGFTRKLPGNLNSTDEVESNLDGKTLIFADGIVTKACGPNVWPITKEAVTEGITERVDDDNNARPDPLDIKKTVVNLPPEISYNSQYAEQSKEMEDKLKLEGYTFSADKLSKDSCSISNLVEEKMPQSAQEAQR